MKAHLWTPYLTWLAVAMVAAVPPLLAVDTYFYADDFGWLYHAYLNTSSWRDALRVFVRESFAGFYRPLVEWQWTLGYLLWGRNWMGYGLLSVFYTCLTAVYLFRLGDLLGGRLCGLLGVAAFLTFAPNTFNWWWKSYHPSLMATAFSVVSVYYGWQWVKVAGWRSLGAAIGTGFLGFLSKETALLLGVPWLVLGLGGTGGEEKRRALVLGTLLALLGATVGWYGRWLPGATGQVSGLAFAERGIWPWGETVPFGNSFLALIAGMALWMGIGERSWWRRGGTLKPAAVVGGLGALFLGLYAFSGSGPSLFLWVLVGLGALLRGATHRWVLFWALGALMPTLFVSYWAERLLHDFSLPMSLLLGVLGVEIWHRIQGWWAQSLGKVTSSVNHRVGTNGGLGALGAILVVGTISAAGLAQVIQKDITVAGRGLDFLHQASQVNRQVVEWLVDQASSGSTVYVRDAYRHQGRLVVNHMSLDEDLKLRGRAGVRAMPISDQVLNDPPSGITYFLANTPFLEAWAAKYAGLPEKTVATFPVGQELSLVWPKTDGRAGKVGTMAMRLLVEAGDMRFGLLELRRGP